MSSGGIFHNLKVPEVNNCCGCVNDLKTAAAIIAVLGIVTSPLISWAVVRHSYVIRVSCFVTTSSSRPDVVDINLSNVLSFGFGANAGLGPSCLISNSTAILRTDEEMTEQNNDTKNSQFVKTVRFFGWMVLIADFIFLVFSINLLVKMFNVRFYGFVELFLLSFGTITQGGGQKAAKHFILVGIAAITLSFIYGMLYISACVYMGGSFPVFEFVFALVDLMTWSFWLHFFLVLYTYSKPRPPRLTAGQRLRKYMQTRYKKTTSSVVLLFNSGVFLQTESYVREYGYKLSSIHTAGLLCRPFCQELYDVPSPIKTSVNVLRWMLFVFELILIASCFVFLLNIFWRKSITADILILAAIITCVTSVPYLILMIIQEQYTDCRWYYSQIFHIILYFIMWCYFVVIVNSYSSQV